MIRTRGLKKIYRTTSEDVIALDGIDMMIGDGELVALSGPSGSGKTTLLNVIGTLDSITDGDIEFDSCSLRTMDEKAKTAFRRLNLGFIFQSYNLIPVLTALENVELAFKPLSRDEMKRLDVSDTRAASMEVLKDVGLEGFEHRKPGELSGGQQQRVSIARAVVRRPSLLLADEPTANLDSTNSRLILQLLARLNERYGITVLYSSHDAQVLGSVRRVVVLKDGRIIEDRIC
ncbi:MAG: ABC transporter ATP-binding protein [Sphaerochaetaceae bacterium]